MKSFSIARLDLEKIDLNIDYYKFKNNYDPYIFMNFETVKALNGEISYHSLKAVDKNNLILKYKGYKVFIDNTLDFGEIELR